MVTRASSGIVTRASGIGVIALLISATLVGCTFLISFDDVPQDDAGAEEDVGGGRDAGPVVPEGGGIDADAADTGPAPFPPACDLAFPLKQVDCTQSPPRPNCAKRTAIFATYPAGQDRTNDLVGCTGAANPTCVQHCPFGCAEMPAGFPDQCDDCNGRKDGYYCGKDLRGWAPANDDLAVQCENGITKRGAVCGDGKCASKCPNTNAAPSCCVP